MNTQPTIPAAARLAIMESLRQEAEQSHQQYPQYKGYWDGWVLVRINRTITTKMGLAFVEGQYALANPTTEEMPNLRTGKSWTAVTVYSPKTGANTCLKPGDIQYV